MAYEFVVLAGLCGALISNTAHRTMNSWVGLFSIASVLFIYGSGGSYMHTSMMYDAELQEVFAAVRVGHANNSVDGLMRRQPAAFLNIPTRTYKNPRGI